jgi:uncharacterized SAM-binding protein YcdF (DUF218 family)
MLFALKKLLTPFVVPPGVFVLLLIALGTHRLFVRKRRSGLAGIFLGLLLWAACTGPLSNSLMENLESRHPIPKTVEGDVIVLLGGGVIDGVPDLSGSGAPTGHMYPRIVTAVRLQKRLGLPVIVSGGKIREDATPEAVIVKRFLVDLGVEERRIILEDRSRDTFENAAFTREICGRHAFGRPILLTSAHHMTRSVETFRKAGLNVAPFPTNFHSLGHRPHNPWSYLPSADSLWVTSAALHEYLGLLFYRIAH